MISKEFMIGKSIASARDDVMQNVLKVSIQFVKDIRSTW